MPLVRLRLVAATVLVASITLPLLGRVIRNLPLAPLREFPPPLNVPGDFPVFSWLAAGLIVVALAAVLLPWLILPRREVRRAPVHRRAPSTPFPFWGWLALGWTLFWWVLAWTRFDIFSLVQPHTFFPLWLGFILTVNALVVHRSGSSLLTRAPGRWIALFLASAVFWWAFEWLNRFVQNWHYLGVSDFSALRYFLHASLCFATVLPAVMAVRELLETARGWQYKLAQGPRVARLEQPVVLALLVLAGIGGLLGLGAAPDVFYPAVWAAPLALFWGLRRVADHTGMLRELALGDWSRATSWALAALICGFFWELWNFYSMPKWIYTVPYVDRWHLFEMPMLGYLGYLPFGILCGLAVEALVGEG